MNNGVFQQRIGALIEAYICKRSKLYPNQRQQQRGYFDAYNEEHLYEIKAILKKTDRVTIRIRNHEELVGHNGRYIFVLYELVDKDKDLSVITDINVLEIIEEEASRISKAIAKYGVEYTRIYASREKTYTRIKFDHLKGD